MIPVDYTKHTNQWLLSTNLGGQVARRNAALQRNGLGHLQLKQSTQIGQDNELNSFNFKTP